MHLVFLALRFIEKLIAGLTDHLVSAASSPWQAGGQVMNLGFDTEWILPISVVHCTILALRK
jgi:hypothetical protein